MIDTTHSKEGKAFIEINHHWQKKNCSRHRRGIGKSSASHHHDHCYILFNIKKLAISTQIPAH